MVLGGYMYLQDNYTYSQLNIIAECFRKKTLPIEILSSSWKHMVPFLCVVVCVI